MKDTFANRMREAMNKANLRQADIVEKTGIGKSAISQYLSGYCEPKQTNIYKIALALGVNEAWIMGFNVDPSRENLNLPTQSKSSLPPLTEKDERQIAKDLENMIEALNGAAAYNDSDDEEDAELLKASLLTSMRLAKQIAKKKFTPKKYRGE